MSTPIWTTQSGERIPVTKMTDRHLINAHRMMVGNARSLERQHREAVSESLISDTNDFGEESLMLLLSSTNRWVRDLGEEMKRRQI